MSWVDGRLLGMDLETTDKDPMVAVPVSYAFVLRRGQRMSIESKLIDPEVEIPEDATAIHGITTERARAEGMPLPDALAAISERLSWAERQAIPLVGMNLSYDLTIIHRLDNLSGWHGNVFDVFVLDKALHKYRKGSRKLSALAEHYKIDQLDLAAHDAGGDAIRSILVLLAMAEKWPWMAKSPPSRWHQRQLKMWADQQRADLSEYFVEQGKEPIPWEDYGWPIKRSALKDEAC